MSKSLLTQIASLFLITIGYISPIYSEILKSAGFYALSGGLTNWLAIHMLFEKIPFLYGSGVITTKFESFKNGIKELITKEFFNEENISRFLGNSDGFEFNQLANVIQESINYDEVFDKLKVAILESPFGGMLGMFGGADALEPLKPNFEQKLKEIIKEISESETLQEKLKSKLSSGLSIEKIHKIIDQRLEELTPQMVKEIIQNMIKEHLGWLVVWGGVFGGLIGAIIGVLN